MAPSKESGALKAIFTTFAAKMPQDGNPYLQRVIYDQLQNVASEAPDVTYEDISLPGYESGEKYRGPAKWVKPHNGSKSHILLFMHGGGYSFGSLNSHRKMCAHFATSCNALALMVDYRMTPEHAYPAAIDDCVSAYKYLLDQGFKPENVVMIGDSCGGGLATTVPLKAAREGLPKPGASVALSPWTDCANATSESIKSNAQNDALSAQESIDLLAERYVDAAGASRQDPLISPIYAEEAELKRACPPHWFSCAGHDMLLNDGTRMAKRLEKAGVEVVLKIYEGQQHVFEFMAGKAPEVDQSISEVGEWVRKKIGS